MGCNDLVFPALFQCDIAGRPTIATAADQNSLQLGVQRNARHRILIGDDQARPATLQAIADFAFRGQRGCGDDHGADLDGRQYQLPNGGNVGQAKNNPVAGLDALALQEVCHPVGPLG